jgi:8-amino-7-oxononanoate synthase
MFAHQLQSRLDKIRNDGRWRNLFTIHSLPGVEVECNGQRLINFCSNDYLGFAGDARVRQALIAALNKYGTGARASPLICGHSTAHEQLEQQLARFTARDRALVFSSGYHANLGAVTALVGRGDWVVLDRLAHASLVDAAVLSRARLLRFAHNDPAALARALERCGAGCKLVVVEGVYSMDGDLAPLPEIVAACRTAGAWLLVDDAHGFGVLGRDGGGTLSHYRISQEQAPVLIATFGKALGVHGAFVAGPAALIELLVQRARSYIYSTALPPALAAAASGSLALVENEAWRQARLHELISRFREGATKVKLPLRPSLTPIQPVVLGSNSKAVQVSEYLLQNSMLVRPIRPPTVPEGTARLRISLSAAHQNEHLDKLLDTLAEAV